jgi:3-oxoacyl-[acyl-carrier-protein] synthase I
VSRAYVAAMTLTSAAGVGNEATVRALRAARGGLARRPFLDVALDTCTGPVDGLERVELPEHVRNFECRASRLAELALRQDGFVAAVAAVRERYGAKRVGVYVGTSGAGILEVELGYRRRGANGALPPSLSYRESMNLFSPAAYLIERLRLAGPAAVVSAACASSAKAFASAARAIAVGLCDAAIVGGVETLALTTLYGFRSLELLSSQPCRPCDAERDGISLGEAAGYVVLTRDPAPNGLALVGFGESSDAHHLSTPHPEGAGAAMAMRDALAMAELAPRAIDYVNLHGTGTRTNDVAEDAAIRAVLGDDVPRSSTKGWTGHTLGAAGIAEAIVALLAIREGYRPGTLNCVRVDPAIHGNVLLRGEAGEVRHVLSNSFGFGGSNCALVFAHVA